MTNLTWQIHSDDLKAKHPFHRVSLINDFEAVAHGLTTLGENDLVEIQKGNLKKNAPKVILGAGTGLGVCQIVYHDAGYSVLASEGGHCDFAPANEQQIQLLRFLLNRHSHVSYDRILSGLDILNIFSFLAEQHDELQSNFAQTVFNAKDPAAIISSSIKEQPLAKETIDIFMTIYGAQAGNFSLTSLPYGGVYIAGGIAPKLIEQFKSSDFLTAFKQKGRMSRLMEEFRISVIMNTQVGVNGAAVIASTRNIS